MSHRLLRRRITQSSPPPPDATTALAATELAALRLTDADPPASQPAQDGTAAAAVESSISFTIRPAEEDVGGEEGSGSASLIARAAVLLPRVTHDVSASRQSQPSAPRKTPRADELAKRRTRVVARSCDVAREDAASRAAPLPNSAPRAHGVRRRLLSPSPPSAPASWTAADDVAARRRRVLRPPSPSPARNATAVSPSPVPVEPRSTSEEDTSSPNLNRVREPANGSEGPSDLTRESFARDAQALASLTAALRATRASNVELEKKLKAAAVLRRADATRMRQREHECEELRRRCGEVEAALQELRRDHAQCVHRHSLAPDPTAPPLWLSGEPGRQDKGQQTDDAVEGGRLRAMAAELARVKATAAEQAAVLDRLGLRAPYTAELVGAAMRRLRRLRTHVNVHENGSRNATLSAVLASSRSQASDGVATMSVDEQNCSEGGLAARSSNPHALGSLAERLNRPVVAKDTHVAAAVRSADSQFESVAAMRSWQAGVESKENT